MRGVGPRISSPVAESVAPLAALSVIIVNYNAAPFLARCLASLEAHLGAVPHEICVVDNQSTDGSAEMVRRQFPGVQLVVSPRNVGFAAGVNAGLRATRGRYVLWLNPDAELLDDGIAALLAYLEAHPQVGLLGPQIVFADGRRQSSCRSFPSYRTALCHRDALLTRWFPANPWSRAYLHLDWDAAAIRDVDWVSGACVLHRRQLSDALGGLDERFFLYCEDVDFCRRAWDAGWVVRYHPGARVLHHNEMSSRQAPYRAIVTRHRSLWRYYAKHFRRHPLKDAVVAAAIWSRCGYIMMRQVLRRVCTPPRRAISSAG